MTVITNNKILTLALIGIIVGALIGFVVNTGQANAVSLGALGGILGFLAGWFWNTRSAE